VLLGVPEGTAIHLDQAVLVIGPRFRGLKMVPPGPHWLAAAPGPTSQAAARGGGYTPPAGTWTWVEPGSTEVRWWRAVDEELGPAVRVPVDPGGAGGAPLDELAPGGDGDLGGAPAGTDRIGVALSLARAARADPTLDAGLAPYDLGSAARWAVLTSAVDAGAVRRCRPAGGALHRSGDGAAGGAVAETAAPRPATQAEIELEARLQAGRLLWAGSTTSGRDGSTPLAPPPQLPGHPPAPLRFATLPRARGPDRSADLAALAAPSGPWAPPRGRGPVEAAAELQLSFAAFLCGHSLDAFSAWRALAEVVLQADEAALGRDPRAAEGVATAVAALADQLEGCAETPGGASGAATSGLLGDGFLETALRDSFLPARVREATASAEAAGDEAPLAYRSALARLSAAVRGVLGGRGRGDDGSSVDDEDGPTVATSFDLGTAGTLEAAAAGPVAEAIEPPSPPVIHGVPAQLPSGVDCAAFPRLIPSAKSPVVIGYHWPCIDGAHAALCAWLAYSADAVGPPPHLSFRPLTVFPGERAPAVERLAPTGTESVYLLDFAGGDGFAVQLARATTGRVVVLDHHATAADDLRAGLASTSSSLPPPANLDVLIDQNRSGAGLARDHFTPALTAGQRRAVDLVEDGDLWRWRLPGSRAFYAAMDARGAPAGNDWDFERGGPTALSALARRADGAEVLVKTGRGLLAARERRVAELAARAFVVEFLSPGAAAKEKSEAGFGRGLAVTLPPDADPGLRSDLGHALAVEAGRRPGLRAVGAVAYRVDELGDVAIKVSLRSDGGEDVTPIALAHGGGGHRAAASASVAMDDWRAWRSQGGTGA